ncbi:MAG: hypothetical protein H0X31_00315 [Nostocaceae cyanobacterium]|nr:hypothetical protein [Nostocaceae cyanobacterium]
MTLPDFGNIDWSGMKKYRSAFESQVSSIPDLKDAQLSKLDDKFPEIGINQLAIADNYWTNAEHGDSQVPTEQYVSGTVTCSGENKPVAPETGHAASYLELSDAQGKEGKYYGKRWISGDDQQVEGGCGILKSVNGGKEPAGRLVYGTDTFKIVLNKADEKNQEATFSAYMHICADTITGRTCTPYFIPMPWVPVSGHNWVMIGRGVE